MGQIQDWLGNVVGEVDSSGIVRNRMGQTIGRVYAITGEVKNASGTVIGYVNQYGKIYNKSKDYQGDILLSTIRDRRGQHAGMCDFTDPLQMAGGAALLLLFT